MDKDVIILAGGEIPADLRESLDQSILQVAHNERALLPVAGQPAIAHVLESLREMPEITRVFVVGEKNTLRQLPQWMPEARGIAATDKLSLNVLAGLDAAQSDAVLLMTCDVPLVTAQTWREFLHGAQERQLQAAYPIVRSDVMEQAFPGGTRTYAPLREGRFTGGNAFILPRAARDTLADVLETAYSARKNPFKLAGLLGMGFIIRAVLRRLSLVDAERKVSAMLHCRAGAVPMRDASIAFDMDKASDMETVKSTFAKRGKISERK